jgi:hypothetical protein
MARDFSSISTVPKSPAVYALFGGTQRSKYVAYVGIAGDLRSRLNQHFNLRDSSVTTGTSAVSLDPDFITELCWWQAKEFSKKEYREAGELIAFEILEPSLRSRGTISDAARSIARDEQFKDKMQDLFKGPPAGRVEFPSISDLAEKIAELEKRLIKLENKSSK